jgi:PAS domain-containing protein
MVFDLDLTAIPGMPLTSAVAHFAGTFVILPHRLQPAGNFAVALIAILAVMAVMIVIAHAGAVFLVPMRREVLRSRVRQDLTGRDQSLHFLNALLSNSWQPLVVLGTELDFGNGRMLLRQCMAGPDAKIVAHAVGGLEKTGQSFELSARAADGRIVRLRGLPVGHRAVLYLQDSGANDLEIQFRKILDALPAPVWVRSEKLSLCWGNRAYLAAVGAKHLQDALASNAALERSEVDLAAAALDTQLSVEARGFVVVGGKRRTLAINLLPISDACVAGIAIDISDVTGAHVEMRLAADAHADMLERLPFCVATFSANQCLTSYNSNYAQFWDLSEAWLDTKPSYSEILIRLREARKLPEQRDFAAWKEDQLQAFDTAGCGREEFWHLPGGKSVRVTTHPHLQGGVFILIEDITERLRLEASLSLLTQVQKATLDTLDEGIAIFGPDGRLVLHNAHFAALWRLTETELSGQPHITDIASICNARLGPDGIWSMVSSSVTSMEQERRGKWGKATRADGRIISLCSSRLPNGASVITFMDLTDLERFEALQRVSPPDPAPVGIKANRNS